MLPLLLAAVLGQAKPPAPPPPPPPHVVVMITRREGLGVLEVAQLADRMAAALKSARVPVVPPSETEQLLGHQTALGCRGKPACVAGLGRQVGASAAIGIEAANLFGEWVMRLMLVDTRGTLLLDRATVLPPDRIQEVDLAFGEFADATRPAIAKLPAFARPPEAAPQQAAAPPPAPKPFVWAEAARWMSWGTVGGGVVLGAAGGASFLVAADATKRFNDYSRPRTPEHGAAMTKLQGEELAWRTTGTILVGAGLAVAAGGAAWVVLSSPRAAKPSLSVLPLPGGAVISASF